MYEREYGGVNKIVKKGAVWSHHGRRRGMQGLAIRLNREACERARRDARRKGMMYDSIRRLFDSLR